jgi:DNA-binding transcriptional ArsR family regulator
VLGDVDATFGEGSGGLFHSLAILIVDRPDLGDPAALVDHLGSMSSDDIAATLLQDVLPGPEGEALVRRALSGDTAARTQVEEAVSREVGAHHCEETIAFIRDPGPAWERAHRALVAWLPAFQEVTDRVVRLQEADLATHAGDHDPSEPGPLIERVTGGLRWLPDPAVRRVVLAPSYFSRPFNYLYQGPGFRLFCYPIADAILEAADRSAPPASMVRLYRALGDATRMRILRLLADRDLYLTELATRLDLSKPTTKHHLALLRAAGLVTVVHEGNLTYYSIRRDRLQQAGTELTTFLA